MSFLFNNLSSFLPSFMQSTESSDLAEYYDDDTEPYLPPTPRRTLATERSGHLGPTEREPNSPEPVEPQSSTHWSPGDYSATSPTKGHRDVDRVSNPPGGLFPSPIYHPFSDRRPEIIGQSSSRPVDPFAGPTGRSQTRIGRSKREKEPSRFDGKQDISDYLDHF